MYFLASPKLLNPPTVSVINCGGLVVTWEMVFTATTAATILDGSVFNVR